MGWAAAPPRATADATSAAIDMTKYWRRRLLLWSKYDSGVLMDDEGWYSVTPETVAAHIARRYPPDRCCLPGVHPPLLSLSGRLPSFTGTVIVDGFCGYGGNTIQFALCNPECVVIGIDSSLEHIEMAKCVPPPLSWRCTLHAMLLSL